MVINESEKKFNDLYEVNKQHQQKKKNLLEKQQKTIIDNANYKKIDTKSEKITNDIKVFVFTELFTILDIEKDNKIYGNNVDLSSLPESLKKIIEPLIFELREQNESLTKYEFIMACEHLYKVNSKY